MVLSHRKILLTLFLLVATLTAVACKKNIPAAPAASNVPPAPVNTPPTPAPTITLRAEPATIERGGSVTLQWEARNAASVTIEPGVGEVPITGNRSLSPTSSVSYQATATGPGGTAGAVARVTVNAPAAPAERPAPTNRPTVTTTDASFTGNVQDVTFDYDKADIRSDMVPVLEKNVAWLKANANVRVNIEGHCDDRGSEEYNLGLGDRRANAVKEYLLAQGIPANRITTISYGEERPVCRDETEQCFERNRRAHFAEVR